MKYRNGEIPLEELVLLASGTNEDGYWEHRLSPATAARWVALVQDVWLHEGVALYISPGWNAYRPLAAQILAKRKYGRLAAAVGFSSHGGYFEGRDTLAIDVANWGDLGAETFFAYARKHGFIANYFDGKNGRPLEQWHIIDPNPFTGGAAIAGGSSTSITTVPEEDDMSTLFLMTTEAQPGQGYAKGILRWLVNSWPKGRREITTEEEALYKTLNYKAVPGLQPLSSAEIYPITKS
jgi:hypothetical protein